MQRNYQLFWAGVLLLISIGSSSIQAAENIRLQLKWQHVFQFAGYYAAKELGYYREAGLNVEIFETQPGTDTTRMVLEGKAEYGVGNSDLLLLRDAGEPLVVLAVILQHSPFTLLTQQRSPTQNIHDLVDKHLMLTPQADEIVAYLNQEGMPLKNFKRVQYDYNIQDFVSGKVEALSAYTTDEPYLLQKLGIKFYSYSPRSAGIDFYGDNLFTTENELKQHPERVRNFRDASLRGWRYAMDHQDEIIDLILAKYSKHSDRDFLVFEANQMRKLMHPELIDIGYMYSGRWRHIAETYAGLGMLPDNISLDGFLYNTDQPQELRRFYIALLGALLVITLALLLIWRFSTLNAQLKSLLHLKSKFANIGESVNNISHQWKQPLNELGIQLMLIEQMLKKRSLPDNEDTEIENAIEKSHNLLEFMAQTVDTFGHLLNTNGKTTRFHPKSIIKEILYLVKDTFEFYKITISYEVNTDIQISGNPTELAHVMLSIINNSRDIIQQRQIASPHILIKAYEHVGNYCIEISDNAGGVWVKPINNIFKPGFSSKQDDNSGVGLYIAKKIVEDCFDGTIGVENHNSGALFTIALPYIANEQA